MKVTPLRLMLMLAPTDRFLIYPKDQIYWTRVATASSSLHRNTGNIKTSSSTLDWNPVEYSHHFFSNFFFLHFLISLIQYQKSTPGIGKVLRGAILALHQFLIPF